MGYGTEVQTILIKDLSFNFRDFANRSVKAYFLLNILPYIIPYTYYIYLAYCY